MPLNDEFEIERLENVILDDLGEIFENKTTLNMYTRTMLVTLKLAFQSGYGKETSDSIYNMLMTTLLMFMGWIYTTYVLILVSNVIMASTNSKDKFEELMREVSVFCEAKKLSKQLRKKIRSYFKYKFQKHYFNEEAIRSSTPTSLRKEIMLHSCSNLIAKVTLFKGLPRVLLEDIASCLKMEIYFPEDVIIQANTLGDSMYFIAFGTAAVYSPSGKIF